MASRMKVSVILTSYNRPHLVVHSLASVAFQTHRDIQLVVVDDSDAFDIRRTVAPFGFRDVEILHFDVAQEDRRRVNRLGVNVNAGMEAARGDLIAFLADDDYYYPTWFEHAVRAFEGRPDVDVVYGKLMYSESFDLTFPTEGRILYPDHVTSHPGGAIDHNQVVHRRFEPPVRWREDATVEASSAPDGLYFNEVASRHPFHPVPAFACVKRLHRKNYQNVVNEHLAGRADVAGLRE